MTFEEWWAKAFLACGESVEPKFRRAKVAQEAWNAALAESKERTTDPFDIHYDKDADVWVGSWQGTFSQGRTASECAEAVISAVTLLTKTTAELKAKQREQAAVQAERKRISERLFEHASMIKDVDEATAAHYEQDAAEFADAEPPALDKLLAEARDKALVDAAKGICGDCARGAKHLTDKSPFNCGAYNIHRLRAKD